MGTTQTQLCFILGPNDLVTEIQYNWKVHMKTSKCPPLCSLYLCNTEKWSCNESLCSFKRNSDKCHNICFYRKIICTHHWIIIVRNDCSFFWQQFSLYLLALANWTKVCSYTVDVLFKHMIVIFFLSFRYDVYFLDKTKQKENIKISVFTKYREVWLSNLIFAGI